MFSKPLKNGDNNNRKNQTLPEVERLLNQAQVLIEQGRNFLLNEGKVIDTTKYLTIKRYCQKYSIEEESVVTN